MAEQDELAIKGSEAGVGSIHAPLQFEPEPIAAAFLTDGDKRGEMAVRVGMRWQDDNKSLFDHLPRGTGIAVNVDDGRFVTGRNSLEAMDEFERQFGRGAVAYVFRVDLPITLGGWPWRLPSDR